MTSTTGLEDGILKKDGLGRVRTPRGRREALLAEFDRSGMSGQKFAAWAGIKYTTFANWLQKRRRQRQLGSEVSKGVQWVEAVVARSGGGKEATTGKPDGLIVHAPDGLRIEITEVRQVSLAVQLLREWKRGC